MKAFLVIIIFFLSLAFSSCMLKVPTELKQGFKYCYDGKNTGLDTLINLQGYYTKGSISGFYPLKPSNSFNSYDFNTIKGIDTTDIHLMFFPDGTFLYNFFPSNHQESIAEYFRRIVNSTNKGEKDLFYKAYAWGRYIVANDTIKAQYYHRPTSLNDNWSGSERWFKIVSKNEVIEIDTPYTAEWNESAKKQGIARFKSLPAQFTPVEVLPPPDAKLKEQDWFWCKPTGVKETKSH